MGKNKYIESPDKMWEYFLAYKDEVKNSPVFIKDWVGKDADQVYREKEKPLTFVGFQNYLDDKGIIGGVEQYFENREDRYTEYIGICSRIKRNIKDDQITGGMVGIYNPSITQRLNNLAETSNVNAVVSNQPLLSFDPLENYDKTDD